MMSTGSILLVSVLVIAQPDLDQASQAIVEQTNEFRQQHDRARLKTNPQLQAAASYFADYMAQNQQYGHEADGQTPAERAEQENYEYCIVLENIAYQYRTRPFRSDELAQAFAKGWQKSPEHRENMLDPDITETAVAIARDEEGAYYAVQLFGRPRSEQIEFEITNKAESDVFYDLSDREFRLRPGYTRSHHLCRPAEITVQLGEEETKTVTPRSGDRLAIVEEDQGLSLKRR